MKIFNQSPSKFLSQPFIEHCCRIYQMDHNGFHGFAHWMRVLHNGRLLTETENANLKIVELFCLLHDTQRQNEDRDPEHGSRAADYAQAIRGTFFDLEDDEMKLLDEALRYHSDGYVEADITVQVCWDADRLDLGRVGKTPKSSYLGSSLARDPNFIEMALMRSKKRFVSQDFVEN